MPLPLSIVNYRSYTAQGRSRWRSRVPLVEKPLVRASRLSLGEEKRVFAGEGYHRSADARIGTYFYTN
ncbi:hypothetical protein [Tolypothrix sp. VBCCA 56010]|uniref:hypothetical protein n=1 Tax=Tolypothrix sp. VBCCA 56010 TaxID=3137731 RepID=UPI003D7C7C0C